MQRCVAQLIFVLILTFASFAAHAQPVAPPNIAPTPLWDGRYPGDPQNWPSPDAACQAQHDYYNPGATLQPPTYNGGRTAECNWTLNPSSNTILSGQVAAYCPTGYQLADPGICLRSDAATGSRAQCACDSDKTPKTGTPTPTEGNPIALNQGAKVDYELDYASAEPRFSVARNYYSLGEDFTNTYSTTPVPGFGARWHGVVPGRLAASNSGYRIEYLDVDGSFAMFTADDPRDQSVWTFHTYAATRSRLSMITVPTVGRYDFFYTQASVANGPAEVRMDMSQGEYILFRRSGASGLGDGVRYLVPIEHGWADGYKITYSYTGSSEFPNLVSDSFGRQMTLTWTAVSRDTHASLNALHDTQVISEIGLPDGTKLQYNYGKDIDVFGSRLKNRLEGVKRLSPTNALLWGRTYLYEDANVPYGLTGKVDQNGNRLSTYSYDASGFATSTELAGGVNKFQIINLEDTSWGAKFIRQVTNPLGYRQDFVFFKEHNWSDAQRVLKSVTNYAMLGVEASTTNYNYYGYVGDMGIADYTDENGRVLHYDIDGGLRPTTTREATGTSDQRTTTTSWDPVFDLPSNVQRPGLTTDYTYSPTGLLLTVKLTDTTTQTVPYSTAGQIRQWTYNWNGNGRLSSVNGPKGPDANGNDDITTFTYDTSGNLLTVTNALGQATNFANYDANGRPGKMTDANGIDTQYIYDALGRVSTITVKDPAGAIGDAVTTLDYDVEGRVIGITAPATEKMFIDYDLAGRKTAIRAANGEQIAFTYDAASNVTAQTVKRVNGTTARSISRTFDGLSRLVTETLGTNRTTTYAYDKLGNVTSVTSARSNAMLQGFDALNRLTSATAPDGGASATAYDVRDNPTSFTDPKSVTTNFVRDGFGDLIQEVSPDRGTSTYYYDAAGDRIAAIDGRGQRIDIVRDALGRIVTKTPVGRPTAEIVYYTYDTTSLTGSYSVGRLSKMVDASGITKFKYDHRGNVLTKQQSIGTTTAAPLQYLYDLADRIVSVTYPSGRVVGYVRDTKGRVTLVKIRASAVDPLAITLASGMTYEPFGSLLTATLGNGLTLAQDWGNDGRLASKRLYQTAGGTNLSLLTYAYDNDDNIASITDGVDPTRTMTYDYDVVGRLARTVAASGGVKRVDFLQDKNGNRTGIEYRTNAGDVTPASTTNYALTAGTNRLASIADASGTRTITYDGRGNTVSETRTGSITAAVDYDGYARLTSYARTDVGTFVNAYNGLEDRISTATTSGGVTDTRHFVYDGDGRLIGEYGTSATDVKAETIWLSPSVSADGEPFGGDDGVSGYAPLAVVAGGIVYWEHGNHLGVPIATTDPSGVLVNPTGFNRLGFPGQIQTTSDLYYNRYRDYDPTIGRYIQADPIGLDGDANPYPYAAGNPLGNIDPTGLQIVIPVPRPGYLPIPIPGITPPWLMPTKKPPAWPYYVPQVQKPAIPDVCPDDLCEQLTLAEAMTGAGRTIMWKLADEPRLIALYGPGPWVKRQHTHVCPDGRKLVVHYFMNKKGYTAEFKFV